jgi:hypothetical protein
MATDGKGRLERQTVFFVGDLPAKKTALLEGVEGILSGLSVCVYVERSGWLKKRERIMVTDGKGSPS